MKAVLLVAGLGTRLKPLTDTTPKCLLPIGGKPLLQIWFEKLEQSGVTEVLVNTHWIHQKVEDFIDQKRPQRTIAIHTFHEPDLLGSGGTLLANRQWLSDGDPFFIVYGDNLTWVDLGDMAKFHHSHGMPVTLGVFRAPCPERCGIAETDPDGTVVSFIEKPDQPRSNLAAAGVYIADHRIFDFFNTAGNPRDGVLDLGFHVFPKMSGRMKVFDVGELIDIGTPHSYEMANQIWKTHRGAI